MIFNVSSASAHTSEISTFPSANSHLTTLPKNVQITFATNLMNVGTAMVVLDPSQKNIVSGPIEMDVFSISAPISQSLKTGTYQVSYRVVSADGHPVEGRFNFFLGESSSETKQPSTFPEKTGKNSVPLVFPIAVVISLVIALVYRRYRKAL